jgi:hypothetical protein
VYSCNVEDTMDSVCWSAGRAGVFVCPSCSCKVLAAALTPTQLLLELSRVQLSEDSLSANFSAGAAQSRGPAQTCTALSLYEL